MLMTPGDVFSIANTIVLPMWLLMIVVPTWKVTQWLVDFRVIPILLSVIYVIYIAIAIQTGGMMDFGSLVSVMELFTEENAVLAGWVHYLAFDLLVGMWLLDQNKSIQINPWFMAPVLLLTFMLGPVGFLLFNILKSFKTKRS